MTSPYVWSSNFLGAKSLPPGQFSFDKEASYQDELNEEYKVLIAGESNENHGAPYWLSDVQREITHSGESPLFTNKLLATGKFEQEHGVISFERALLHSNVRRSSAPRRRHLNGKKEYYRPNSTHQYLSATDLRNLHENEENIVRYGRPTRTTLLRARQRTGSAPVNSYDTRREQIKRIEDVKNNSMQCTGKEYYNIYTNEGETMHSFLTGARYNRAHLLDSKGLSVYGIYMPRENPTDCFITTHRRMKDVGDEIPVAPPDSPRSDYEETPSPPFLSRPSSSRPSRPTSSGTSSSHPVTRTTTSSRPQSHKKFQPKSPMSRLGSAKDQQYPSINTGNRPPPLKNLEVHKQECTPDEITMVMPDHINKAGKMGVYVTLKGQKMIETVESKLPRVTGVSFPKLRKSRDAVDEMLIVNQPPPTPVDISVASIERNKTETVNAVETTPKIENRFAEVATEKEKEPLIESETIEKDLPNHTDETKIDEQIEKTNEIKTETSDKTNPSAGEYKELNISKVVVTENEIIERKALEIGPAKRVNFKNDNDTIIINEDNNDITKEVQQKDNKNENRNKNEPNDVNSKKIDGDNVVFFITEDDEKVEQVGDKPQSNSADKGQEINGDTAQQTDNIAQDEVETENNDNETAEKTVDDVIKVEISETEKKQDSNESREMEDDSKLPITSDEFPFTQSG